MRIDSAKELIVYEKAYEIAMRVFEISKRFPPEERYALTGQIRRSSRCEPPGGLDPMALTFGGFLQGCNEPLSGFGSGSFQIRVYGGPSVHCPRFDAKAGTGGQGTPG